MTIEEGTYRARVRSHSFGVSSKKGTEFVLLNFRISAGESYEGYSVERRGWLTDKAIDRTLEDLKTCGWDGVDLENLGPLDNEVQIVVKHEENERDGSITAVVAFINEIGSSNVGRAMDKGRLRQLAQRVKARQGAPAASTSRVSFGGDEPDDEPAPAPARDTAPDPVNEPDDEPARTLDDIPF